MKNAWLWVMGIGAIALYWLTKKPGEQPPPGVSATVDAQTLASIHAPGPWGVWTQVTNTGSVSHPFMASAVGDVLGVSLSITPANILYDLAPGQTGADSFWFYLPEGMEGNTGKVTVTVKDQQGNAVATDTASFMVEPLY